MAQAVGQEARPDSVIVVERPHQEAVSRAGLGVHRVESGQIGRGSIAHDHAATLRQADVVAPFGLHRGQQGIFVGRQVADHRIPILDLFGRGTPAATPQRRYHSLTRVNIGAHVGIDLDEERARVPRLCLDLTEHPSTRLAFDQSRIGPFGT